MSIASCIFSAIITIAIAGILYFKYPARDSKKKDIIGHPARPRHERWLYARIIGLLILGGCWSILLPLTFNQDITKFQIFGMPYIPAIILTFITLLTFIILFLIYPAWNINKKDNNEKPAKSRHERWFYAWIIGWPTLGVCWAMFLPLVLNQNFNGADSDGNQLRLHFIYISGGIIALVTLGENHRKNTIDREKSEIEKNHYQRTQENQASELIEQQRRFNATMEQEYKKFEAYKAKNEQEHIRQVHTERRSRYSQAVEQLASSHAPVRMGGVYTLVGLVDEWLADKSLSETERHKEGQNIINNLCAYIRSSFSLAERYDDLTLSYEEYQKKNTEKCQRRQDLTSQKDFAKYKAIFQEEVEVRQTILETIRKNLLGPEYQGGIWSPFEYNLSNVIFFYDVSLYFAVFKGRVDFENSVFKGTAGLSDMSVYKKINFRDVVFNGKAYFTSTNFTSAIFTKATFKNETFFYGTTFEDSANFADVTFNSRIVFIDSCFYKKVTFEGIPYTSQDGKITLINPPAARFARGITAYFVLADRSSYSIETEEHRSPEGIVTTIPKGCIVFDPETKESIPNYRDILVLFDKKSTSTSKTPKTDKKLVMSVWPKNNASDTHPSSLYRKKWKKILVLVISTVSNCKKYVQL